MSSKILAMQTVPATSAGDNSRYFSTKKMQRSCL